MLLIHMDLDLLDLEMTCQRYGVPLLRVTVALFSLLTDFVVLIKVFRLVITKSYTSVSFAVAQEKETSDVKLDILLPS